MSSKILELSDIKFIYNKNIGIDADGTGLLQQYIDGIPTSIQKAIALLYGDINTIVPDVDFDIEFVKAKSTYTIYIKFLEHIDVLTKKFIYAQIDKHISFSSSEV